MDKIEIEKVKQRARGYHYIHAYRKHICEICGEKTNYKKSRKSIEGHHEDYTKPLDVIYLCASCHIKRHKLNKEFIHAERTKTVFAAHGYDIVAVVEKEIESNVAKYQQYYRGYFAKEKRGGKSKGGHMSKRKMKMVHLAEERWNALREIAETLRGDRGANVSVQELVALAIDQYLANDYKKGE